MRGIDTPGLLAELMSRPPSRNLSLGMGKSALVGLAHIPQLATRNQPTRQHEPAEQRRQAKETTDLDIGVLEKHATPLMPFPVTPPAH